MLQAYVTLSLIPIQYHITVACPCMEKAQLQNIEK